MKNYIRIPGTNRHLNPKLVKFAKLAFTAIVIVTIINTIAVMYTAIASTPVEMFDSISLNNLRGELNNGDKEAIEYYKENFIARNNYVFDGPLTIRLMAEQYGLDYAEVMQQYKNGDYESAQEFYELVIKK